jgi:hypothetical protein
MASMGPSISLRTLMALAAARRWPVRASVAMSPPFTSTTMPRRRSALLAAAPASVAMRAALSS